MAYQNEHFDHLSEIIELVKVNKIDGENEALQKFTLYLDTIQSIGPFDLDNWRINWREKVWALGEEFKRINPNKFLQIIDGKLLLSEIRNKEVIHFIRSEIAFNFLPDIECKKILESLIEKYPLNPEFRHTLGHYYGSESKLLEAINEYKLALKIDPNNRVFLKNRFTTEYDYLNKLISEGEFQKGKDYVQEVFQEKFYINVSSNYHSAFIDFNARFSDHLIFQNKIKQIENEFRARIHTELENERKRIIEVLGFFSAIVAFILSTVSIGKNFSFIEATYFIIALGIILILFAVSLSTVFSSSNKNLLKDGKFWILSIGLILLFLFICATNSLSTLLQFQRSID
jgi:tetratricopeptide (TPR) repeat protein